MQHPVSDLLSPALIPELGSDVAACPSCNIELGLVGVAAVGALPDELAVALLDPDLTVEAADLTVVRLCIQFSIHYVIVDKADHG